MGQDFHIPPDLIRHQELFRPLAGEENWGMARLGVDRLRDEFDGTGITVCIVDTGLSHHPLIEGRFEARSFVPGEPAVDGNGHGSHCAGTVGASDPRIGVGKGLRLLGGKGLSNAGSGAGSWIANAMQWGWDNGATVFSLSLGSSSPDSVIQAMCDKLAGNGAWIFAAAGNSGGGTPNVDFPGRFESCLSVAAIDSAFNPASFSSAGAKIDTSAPGVGIWSIRPGGGAAMMSGTSMACPFGAGVGGVYRSALVAKKLPIPNVTQLRELLNARSTDAFSPGDDNRTGPGWINPLLLFNTLDGVKFK